MEYEPEEDEPHIGQQLVRGANHLALDPALCAFTVVSLNRKNGSGACFGGFDCSESTKPQVFRALAKMLTDHAADLYRMANKAEGKQ